MVPNLYFFLSFLNFKLQSLTGFSFSGQALCVYHFVRSSLARMSYGFRISGTSASVVNHHVVLRSATGSRSATFNANDTVFLIRVFEKQSFSRAWNLVFFDVAFQLVEKKVLHSALPRPSSWRLDDFRKPLFPEVSYLLEVFRGARGCNSQAKRSVQIYFRPLAGERSPVFVKRRNQNVRASVERQERGQRFPNEPLVAARVHQFLVRQPARRVNVLPGKSLVAWNAVSQIRTQHAHVRNPSFYGALQ